MDRMASDRFQCERFPSLMTLTFASMALSDATARFSLRHNVSDCAPSRHEAVNVSSSYRPLQIATRIMCGLFFFPRTMKGLRMNMELRFNDAVRQERDPIQYPTAISTTAQMSPSDTTSLLAELGGYTAFVPIPHGVRQEDQQSHQRALQSIPHAQAYLQRFRAFLDRRHRMLTRQCFLAPLLFAHEPCPSGPR